MRNKKISALLLIMTMLVALVVPVQASEAETLTLLTQNGFDQAKIEQISALTGKTVSAYPSDGYVPAVSVTADGFGNTATMFDGVIDDRAWSSWGNKGETYNLFIDLGGVQTIENVIYWNNSNGADKTIGGTYSDTTWEAWKDTFDFATMAVSTSDDGSAWTERVAAFAPTTATADSTFCLVDGSNTIVRVYHAHVATLAEPVSARYVKLTVKEKSDDFQFRTGEVAVLGQATAKAVRDVLTANPLTDEIKSYVEKAANIELVKPNHINITKMVVTDPLGRANPLTDSANLQNGNVTTREVCTGGWQNNRGYIDIDLGAVQEVTNVFLWNIAQDTGKTNGITGEKADHTALKGESFKTVQVLTSVDGKTYAEGEKITLGERTVDEVWFSPTMQNIGHSYQYDLAQPTDARYIRVSIDFGFHLNMGEVMVIGNKKNGLTRQLISGNGYGSASNNIEAYYANIGATVTQIENKDATFTSATYNTEKVNQGFMGAYGATAGSNGAYSSWGSNNHSIVVDLGAKYYVNGADVDASCDHAGNTIGSMKVEVSADNVDFTEVVPAQNSYVITAGDPAAKHARILSSVFEPVLARYVRFTVTAPQQIVVNELLVFGAYGPSATAPVFVDKDGADYVNESLGGNGLFAKTEFKGSNGTLVVGWYDKDMKNLKRVWLASGTGELSIDLSSEEKAFSDAGTDVMKAFAFDSLTNLELLAPSVTTMSLGE